MSEIEFHERLGRGGYGEVYRATWFRPDDRDRIVAVKLLNASVRRGSDAARRLRDEAHMLASIRHPNILRVYDLTELEGHVAMVVEYVPGDDLDRCVLDGMPPRAVLEALSDVALALCAAWSAPSKENGKPLRLVHRDIKPENLRIRPDGRLKILDFGVARASEMTREAETATNTVMGSYRYMAPERFDSQLEPHPSVDVFALGCILYEGLAFRRLFEHLSMREMMVLSIPGSERYHSYIAERLEELPDSTNAKTINLIHRLVDRDPERRPLPEEASAFFLALASLLPGPGLKEWATQRDWIPSSAGEGKWSGKRVDLPLKSEFLEAEGIHEDFTPTPERIDLRGVSDYDLPEEVEEVISSEQTEVSIAGPVALPPRLPAPDDVTLTDAIDSLTAATSTPTGSGDRYVEPKASQATDPTEVVDLQALRAEVQPIEPNPEADRDEVLEKEEFDDEVEALRRAIGIHADTPSSSAAPPSQPPRNQSQDTVVANLAVLSLLGVVGLIVLAIILVISFL